MTTDPHPTDYRRSVMHLRYVGECAPMFADSVPLIWPGLVDALAGQPKAQNYGGDGAPTSIVVCSTHHCDISECENDDRIGCTGNPIPRRSDPTGQAATRYDKASADMRQFHKDAKALRVIFDRMVATLGSYAPRQANAYERQITRDNDPGCASCARLPGVNGEPRWEPIEQGVRINGEIVKVCSWCRSWVKSHGYDSLPPRDAVERHHREGDKRIKRGA